MDEKKFFESFWQASSLDTFNVQEFAQQLNSYDSNNKEFLLEYPHAPQPLPKVRNKLNTIAKKRKSERTFSNVPLKAKELSQILSSFYAWNGLEHRAYPSAGATYVTEIFCVTFSVELFSNKILYYDPETHSVTPLSVQAPSWQEASQSLNMKVEGTPNILIIFVTFPERATAKYGERGGRFALIEAGASMQQLALQIAQSQKLKGVAVGGMLDEVWKDQLHLSHTDAHITLGYLIGK